MAPAALSSHLPTSALSVPIFAHLIHYATRPASVQHCILLHLTDFVSEAFGKYDRSGYLRVLILLQAHPTISHGSVTAWLACRTSPPDNRMQF